MKGISVRKGFFGDLSVVVLCVLEPSGNKVSSAVTLAAMQFHPAMIVNIGVGGGVHGQNELVQIGDVVISNAIADHSQSVERGTQIEYIIRSQKIRAELEPAIDEIANSDAWIERLKEPKMQALGPLSSKIIVAPISAGNVRAEGDNGPLALAMKEQIPDARAIDMESAAAVNAAVLLGLPYVTIRGLSDLRIDKVPELDSWSQPWAMAHAAAAGFHLLSNLSAYIQNTRAKSALKLSLSNKGSEGLTDVAFKENVEALAKRLLEINSPGSLQTLFPDSSESTKRAFANCLCQTRFVTEQKEGGDTTFRPLSDLLEQPERMHLVVALPGSGKSHVFWNTAHTLLNEGQMIPLFLRLGQYATWESVKLAIRKAANGLVLADLLADPRICFFLDGWSEFAVDSSSLEKTTLLHELANYKIIANAKSSKEGDSIFRVWELAPFSEAQVNAVLKEADPLLQNLNPELQKLLTLPLFLSLHILSGASESTVGSVLRRFHDNLSKNLPPEFTDTLSEAVARFVLAKELSYDRFIAVLKDCSQSQDIKNSARLLEKLGTILNRDGTLSPIHDLYLDWLAGRGILTKGYEELALDSYKAREGIKLAIQAGEYSRLPVDAKIEEKDVVFAAMLESAWTARTLPEPFKTRLDALLKDYRLAVQSRGGLAALKCHRPQYLSSALKVLDKLIEARIFSQEWRDAIHPDNFIQNVSTVEEWIGGPSTEFFLEEVAAKGRPEWLPILQKLAIDGKIGFVSACSVALAVSPTIPRWVLEHLETLIVQQPWKLRLCEKRKSNVVLAKLIARHYEKFLALAQSKYSSGFQLGDFLAACGDDSCFELLLKDYPAMSDKAQELLGFAISKKGEPWISRFQLQGKPPHSLKHGTSAEIDDATAYQWISAGREDEGWRVLVSRHGASLMPQIIKALPSNFAGIDHVPVLDSLRYSSNLPSSLINEILDRFGSPMMPKAMEECMDAIASVYPEGVPVLINLVFNNGMALPGYHLAHLMDLYEQWHKKSGLSLSINMSNDLSVPFPEWLALYAYNRSWEPHYSAKVIAKSASVATNFILGPLLLDLVKTEEILRELKNVEHASSQLLNHMLASSELAKYIPEVFAISFQEFSSAEIEKCFENQFVDQYLLLTKLETNSHSRHRPAHVELIKKALDGPVEIQKFRQLAMITRCYTEDEVLSLLRSLKTDQENWLWFVREVESARGEFLIYENGEFKS
ncbi:MAG: hypothetical protein JST89_04330 [Cyanobacteria bacterium SZAS-4]|nr:hypothetical protein [Cyanobacteria bacterium SZAS-4]